MKLGWTGFQVQDECGNAILVDEHGGVHTAFGVDRDSLRPQILAIAARIREKWEQPRGYESGAD